jgi:hypothetical protein
MAITVDHAEVELVLNGQTIPTITSSASIDLGPRLVPGRNTLRFVARSLSTTNRGAFTLMIDDPGNGAVLFRTNGRARRTGYVFRGWWIRPRYSVGSIGSDTLQLDWSAGSVVVR